MIALWIAGGLLALIGGIFILGYYGLPEPEVPYPGLPRPDRILPGAEAWEFKGDSDVCFLVIHGFAGSAFNTRPLGEFFHSLGHTAVGPLLPGHGTDPEEMQKTRYYHYLRYVNHLYHECRRRYKEVFLVGFSMGGTLAMDVASRNSLRAPVSGLVLISAPAFFNGYFNGRMIMHDFSLMLTGFARIFTDIIKLDKKLPDEVSESNPWVGYRFIYPLGPLHSFKRAFRGIRRRLPMITSPCCLVMSQNDETVNSENQYYIYSRINSREKRACMFQLPMDGTTRHVLPTHKYARDKVFRFLEDYIEDTLQDMSIPPRPSAFRRFMRFFGR